MANDDGTQHSQSSAPRVHRPKLSCMESLASHSSRGRRGRKVSMLSSALHADEFIADEFEGAALTPIEQYHKLVKSEALRADDHQTRIIQKLQRLHDELATYDPPAPPSSSSSDSIVSVHVKQVVFIYSFPPSHSYLACSPEGPHTQFRYLLNKFRKGYTCTEM